MSTLQASLAAGLLTAVLAAAAQAAGDHADHGASAHRHEAAGAATGSAQAEVRRIDREGRRLTLRHGEIAGLDMPAMTMVFDVQDPALLDGLAVGDKVDFQLVERDGRLVVTGIAPVR